MDHIPPRGKNFPFVALARPAYPDRGLVREGMSPVMPKKTKPRPVVIDKTEPTWRDYPIGPALRRAGYKRSV